MKKVALELGGKNPNIVFADADRETALDFALTAVFLHSGQVCSAGARLVVEESIHDEFVDELVAPGRADPARRPVRREGRDRPADLGRAPREGRGVRRRAGSPRAPSSAAGAPGPTTRRWPTASTTCRRSSTAATAACPSCRRSRSVRCSPSRRSATRTTRSRIANDSIYGLAGGVWTQNAGRAERVAGPAADGHRVDQRLPPLRPAGRVGRLQAVRHRPRARRRRPRRVPRDQAHLAQRATRSRSAGSTGGERDGRGDSHVRLRHRRRRLGRLRAGQPAQRRPGHVGAGARGRPLRLPDRPVHPHAGGAAVPDRQPALRLEVRVRAGAATWTAARSTTPAARCSAAPAASTG